MGMFGRYHDVGLGTRLDRGFARMDADKGVTVIPGIKTDKSNGLILRRLGTVVAKCKKRVLRSAQDDKV
jgi:hypothetical protein